MKNPCVLIGIDESPGEGVCTAGKTDLLTSGGETVLGTLLNGTVISKGAVLSGEVIESMAKSPTEPSRLAVRMDSAQWKNGSAPVKFYLTPWY
jgi:hypothetical protein